MSELGIFYPNIPGGENDNFRKIIITSQGDFLNGEYTPTQFTQMLSSHDYTIQMEISYEQTSEGIVTYEGSVFLEEIVYDGAYCKGVGNGFVRIYSADSYEMVGKVQIDTENRTADILWGATYDSNSDIASLISPNEITDLPITYMSVIIIYHPIPQN